MVIREDFCGVCAAIPVALVGAGAGATGLTLTKDEYKRKRKWLLISGVVSLLISAALIWWSMGCKKCRVS